MSKVIHFPIHRTRPSNMLNAVILSVVTAHRVTGNLELSIEDLERMYGRRQGDPKK